MPRLCIHPPCPAVALRPPGGAPQCCAATAAPRGGLAPCRRTCTYSQTSLPPSSCELHHVTNFCLSFPLALPAPSSASKLGFLVVPPPPTPARLHPPLHLLTGASPAYASCLTHLSPLGLASQPDAAAMRLSSFHMTQYVETHNETSCGGGCHVQNSCRRSCAGSTGGKCEARVVGGGRQRPMSLWVGGAFHEVSHVDCMVFPAVAGTAAWRGMRPSPHKSRRRRESP